MSGQYVSPALEVAPERNKNRSSEIEQRGSQPTKNFHDNRRQQRLHVVTGRAPPMQTTSSNLCTLEVLQPINSDGCATTTTSRTTGWDLKTQVFNIVNSTVSLLLPMKAMANPLNTNSNNNSHGNTVIATALEITGEDLCRPSPSTPQLHHPRARHCASPSQTTTRHTLPSLPPILAQLEIG